MKNARPTEVKASALEPRRYCTAPDLFPATLPQQPLPVFPKPNSVKESALMALIAGPARQSIFTRSWRLAAYVGFLKDDGWQITSRDVSENGRTVSEYLLDLQDEPTRAAASKYRRHAGFIEPHLIGLMATAGPAVAVLVAVVWGWL